MLAVDRSLGRKVAVSFGTIYPLDVLDKPASELVEAARQAVGPP